MPKALLLIILIILVVIIWRWLQSSTSPRPQRSTGPRSRQTPPATLPRLRTEDDVAVALGVTRRQLTWLLDRRNPPTPTACSTHYVEHRIPKAGGGERVLLAPKAKLKAAQRWILRKILNRVALHEAAHGFRAERSIVTNARPHAGQAVVARCDLRDFFPTINYPRVRGLFLALGYPPEAAAALALLCTTRLPGTRRRVLPQGAPTSPAISNIIASQLDRRLTGLATHLGFTYTRYADDCTFSGAPRQLGALIRTVRRIVRGEGFTLHAGKLRIHRRGEQQLVTGLVVNAAPGVPRRERRRLRAILHQARHTGLNAQNRDKHPHFIDYLRGKIAFIHMVNPRQAEALHAALAACIRTSTPPPTTNPGVQDYTPGPERLDF